MGWLTASDMNAFYLRESGIVAMIRFRNGEWWAYDLTSEQWPSSNNLYSPLQIGAYEYREEAMSAVEARYSRAASCSESVIR